MTSNEKFGGIVMAQEVWKWLPGYEGLYKVSNFGEVMSFLGKTPKLRKPKKPDKYKKYSSLTLNKNGIQKTFYVHRLVCMTFHGEQPSDKSIVNHIDGNKLNNRADNLEWSTHSENALHAIEMGLIKIPRKIIKYHAKNENDIDFVEKCLNFASENEISENDLVRNALNFYIQTKKSS